MRNRKHGGRFWRKWFEVRPEYEDEIAGVEHDMWSAWRSHFVDHLGMPPEKHWLLRGRRFKPWYSGRWGPPALFNPFVAELLSKGGGLLPLYVLHLLAEKPRYGNDIMRAIERRTNHRWASNPGAVYPLLSAMEDSGLVLGAWEDADKRTRRIYRLTPAGLEEYGRLKELMRPKLEEAIDVIQGIYDDLEMRVEEE